MNTTTLKTASERGGLLVGGAGVAMLTVALITSAGHGRVTAAARPGPTVTTTVIAPAPTAGRTSAAAHPSLSARSTTSVVAVSDDRTAMPHTAGGDLSHGQARPPSAPTSSPTSPAAAPCSGVLTVRLLQAACVSIGGDR